MAITYGDHLIDSGYYDITPDQEREIEARKYDICDCELSHNGMGMTGRECDCPAGYPQRIKDLEAQIADLRARAEKAEKERDEWRGHHDRADHRAYAYAQEFDALKARQSRNEQAMDVIDRAAEQLGPNMVEIERLRAQIASKDERIKEIERTLFLSERKLSEFHVRALRAEAAIADDKIWQRIYSLERQLRVVDDELKWEGTGLGRIDSIRALAAAAIIPAEPVAWRDALEAKP
jgi:predicted  nucleic acid-binding Zn-ribbon protein